MCPTERPRARCGGVRAAAVRDGKADAIRFTQIRKNRAASQNQLILYASNAAFCDDDGDGDVTMMNATDDRLADFQFLRVCADARACVAIHLCKNGKVCAMRVATSPCIFFEPTPTSLFALFLCALSDFYAILIGSVLSFISPCFQLIRLPPYPGYF